MEIYINKKYLYDAISSVTHIASSKNDLPPGIKIVAKQEGITLTGSNADIIVEKFLPVTSEVQIIQAGSIVVSAKYLSNIVKKLPNEIHMKVDSNQSVRIEAGDIVTNLNGFNPEEYSSLPEVNVDNWITLPVNELVKLVNQTSFAVATNDSRPVLTGVNMRFSKGNLTCIATNSHRLVLKEIGIDSSLEGSIVVPSKSLKELIRLVKDDDSSVSLTFSDNYIIFNGNNFKLYSRLIEGNYPEVSRLIPKESLTRISLDKAHFEQGIERALLFANDTRNNHVRIETLDGTTLKISSNTAEMGSIEETQTIRSIQGETQFNLSLDGIFLKDAVHAIIDSEVVVKISGSMNPIIIEPFEDPTYIQLISPVRTN